jgi:glycosyltransferase involved in cell wall biosynthesis
MKLLQDPDLRSRYGEESRRIAEQFDWRKLALQYLSLYEKVRDAQTLTC